jgi:hypothetical protein
VSAFTFGAGGRRGSGWARLVLLGVLPQAAGALAVAVPTVPARAGTVIPADQASGVGRRSRIWRFSRARIAAMPRSRWGVTTSSRPIP